MLRDALKSRSGKGALAAALVAAALAAGAALSDSRIRFRLEAHIPESCRAAAYGQMIEQQCNTPHVLSIIVDPGSSIASTTYRGRTETVNSRGAAEFDFHSIENGRWPVTFETASGSPVSAAAASVEIRSY